MQKITRCKATKIGLRKSISRLNRVRTREDWAKNSVLNESHFISGTFQESISRITVCRGRHETDQFIRNWQVLQDSFKLSVCVWCDGTFSKLVTLHLNMIFLSVLFFSENEWWFELVIFSGTVEFLIVYVFYYITTFENDNGTELYIWGSWQCWEKSYSEYKYHDLFACSETAMFVFSSVIVLLYLCCWSLALFMWPSSVMCSLRFSSHQATTIHTAYFLQLFLI